MTHGETPRGMRERKKTSTDVSSDERADTGTEAGVAEFWERMRTRLGAEYPAFCRAMNQAATTGVRLRKTPESWFAAYGLRPVPWHPDGRVLERRPEFTLDPLFHAGGYYVQEPSSMLIYQAARETVGPGKRVLDMCAAPGGKSTLLLELGPAVLVANEPMTSRQAVLRETLARFAATSSVVTQADPSAFVEPIFDFVLVDAPCSGEGLWRKKPAARNEWSPAAVIHCAARQKRILSAAYRALRPGGRLVYCTCTFAPEENQINVEWFGRTHSDLTAVEFDFPGEWGVERVGTGYAILPHRCPGEGFFMAAWDKADGPSINVRPRGVSPGKPRMPTPGAWYVYEGQWRVAEHEAARLATILPGVRAVGVAAGKDERKGFVPAHELAYLRHATPYDHPLDRDAALRYLKGEIPLPPPEHPGQYLRLTFAGLGLGWVKAAGNARWNSSLPPALRIRKSLPFHDE